MIGLDTYFKDKRKDMLVWRNRGRLTLKFFILVTTKNHSQQDLGLKLRNLVWDIESFKYVVQGSPTSTGPYGLFGTELHSRR